jgi:hypothetical protein
VKGRAAKTYVPGAVELVDVTVEEAAVQVDVVAVVAANWASKYTTRLAN